MESLSSRFIPLGTTDLLPENFETLEEFWQFWDTHSTADYEYLMKPVDIVVALDTKRTIRSKRPTGHHTKETHMTAIVDIEGIGESFATKLKEAGATSVEKLLEMGATPKGRQELAEKTGISGKLILEWVNRADLYRIKGVGSEYSDLLENAGVDTVAELAQRKAENLHAKMMEVNTEKKLVRRPPTLEQVQSWVTEAKSLPRAVHY